ncbi:MAG: hypothetical protein R3B47_07220 [Bacteroidia bacterium]
MASIINKYQLVTFPQVTCFAQEKASGSELGERVKSILAAGELVSVEIVIG